MGYHNTSHPEFLDDGSKARASKNSEFNDIANQEFAPDRVTSDLFPTLWKPQTVQYPYCLLYTSPSPRDISGSRMPSSA